MAQAKLTLHASRDIPLNKLVLSQANVRREKAGQSIEMLAADIERRGLLQSLSVRPLADAGGKETGMFEVPAGGRRFKALQLLVKQKKLSKTAPIPCIVKTDGLAEEDSLAENVMREGLHPLDQFRAFQTLAEAGQGLEAIAATFGVTAAVVRQRLKLAAASPKLLEAYAADELTLDQLMAFCVSDDHRRQEEVWARLSNAYNREPYAIRRMLTEGAVRGHDRRARFVGPEAYEKAGGVILRDLFSTDEDGWFADAALLDRLTLEMLQARADDIKCEGWKWTQATIDFPYSDRYRYRQIAGEEQTLSDEDQNQHQALQAEYEQIQERHDGADELPASEAKRLDELEAALARFEDRPLVYEPADMAYAGVIVSLSHDGQLRIERGFVRQEDDPQRRERSSADQATRNDDGESGNTDAPALPANGGVQTAVTGEDEVGSAALSDRLMEELTACRTLALREALSGDPEVALLSVLHTFCLKLFYVRIYAESCLEIDVREAGLDRHAATITAMPVQERFEGRRQHWQSRLPADPVDLWDALVGFEATERSELFAFSAALTVNAVHDVHASRGSTGRPADRLAQALKLDMTGAGWQATVESYFGRVTKAQILDCVRDAKGPAAADLIAHLKKSDMAREAERLLQGSGWLPETLRTWSTEEDVQRTPLPQNETPELPAFLDEDDFGESAGVKPYAVAAE
ncbi:MULTISPECIES: ParB/RepB/Spo0J family partition protein [Rhodomicrobium]|uniref:ParB/RepB/Spo0J family partition protein n=1 Tax=Rhodomicrobium TaxID=1068 RepID=UPI000B4BFE64|nr:MULTISPECIES: ParB/RepB/Spo0J family partition protein [Rhodomicrobium]